MNVYEVVTARILEALDSGVVPWRKPWSVNAPRNLVTEREYRGVNVVLLQAAPHRSPWWLTFKQAKSLGGAVKRGERGCPVIFWKIGEHEERGKIEKTFLLRYYTVFNVEQTEGIEIPALEERRSIDSSEECEKIVASYPEPPRIEHGGGQACYLPSTDLVRMPPRDTFDSSASYYATLFHELVQNVPKIPVLDGPGPSWDGGERRVDDEDGVGRPGLRPSTTRTAISSHSASSNATSRTSQICSVRAALPPSSASEGHGTSRRR